MSVIKLFLIASLYINLVRGLKFRVSGRQSGANLELKKEILGKFDHAEDSIATTPYCIAVADGVGSCSYTSKHWSELLVYKFQHFVDETFLEKKFDYEEKRSEIPEMAFKYFESLRTDYNKILNEERDTFESKKGYKMRNEFVFQKTVVSSTLIGAYIDNASEETMNVIQTGDSLLASFLPTQTEEEKGHYYYPNFYTLEMRRGWNFPYQYINYKPEKKKEDEEEPEAISSFSAWITKGSVVIAGSDGLWDNFHFVGVSLLLNMLVNYHKFYDGNWELISKQAELFMHSIADLLIAQFPMIKQGLSQLDFSISPFMEEEVKDPEAKQPPCSLLNKLLCMNDPEPITVKRKELYKRSADRIILKLAADEKDQKSERFKLESSVLNSLISCNLKEYIMWPWRNSRDIIFMKECFRYIFKEQMSVSKEVMRSFQKSFDPTKMSTLFANVAKTYSKIEKDFPSPFFLTYVEDKQSTNYNADGKADDISAIVTIIDEDAPEDKKEHQTAISEFKKDEKKVYQSIRDELPDFYMLVVNKKTYFLI